jgi:glycosyltransferase involved in cell wall biosynthesis
MQNIKYSIVIPTYNSQDVIEKRIELVTTFFEQTHNSYEIILVDDASTDKTWEIIAKIKHVKSIQFANNKGQHAAILEGFKHVNGLYIVTIDQDLGHEISLVKELTALLLKDNLDVAYLCYEMKYTALFLRIAYQAHLFFVKIFKIHRGSSYRIIKRATVVALLNQKTIYNIDISLSKISQKFGYLRISNSIIVSKSKYDFFKILKLFILNLKAVIYK